MSIPLNLINGFLGSGKTTFLLHYLDTFAGGRKIGVIQNEFSPAGIDGELITRQGKAYRLLEVNNGSVFCVCLLGGFINSLSSFIDDYAPDEIIMEASGMSDPSLSDRYFNHQNLKTRYFLVIHGRSSMHETFIKLLQSVPGWSTKLELPIPLW